MSDKQTQPTPVWLHPPLPDHRYIVRCDRGFYHVVENGGLDWTFGDQLGAVPMGWKRMSEHVAMMHRAGFQNITVMDIAEVSGV